MRHRGLSLALSVMTLAASACGAGLAGRPTPAPTNDPTSGLTAPPGPVLFEPEQLIFPPEDFPLTGAAVSHDAPVAVHGWERQFATPSSPDFRWFTVRLFVLQPDVGPRTFVKDNGCGSVTWPGESPVADPLSAPPAAQSATACRYAFPGGARVLYLVTGYRNVGILVGVQPRRIDVGDALALDWLAALARQQIAIIEKVLIAHPPAAPARAASAGG